jgi:hypothetical protein
LQEVSRGPPGCELSTQPPSTRLGIDREALPIDREELTINREALPIDRS